MKNIKKYKTFEELIRNKKEELGPKEIKEQLFQEKILSKKIERRIYNIELTRMGPIIKINNYKKD